MYKKCMRQRGMAKSSNDKVTGGSIRFDSSLYITEQITLFLLLDDF
jgi:hypothetical protein